VAGISSFRGRLRRRRCPGGVALWSSARATSGAVSRLPSGRIVKRRNGGGEPIAQEQPAAPDTPRGKIAATCELVHGGARDAEQLGDLPGRHDICACQRARGWRSHLPKRGPEPPKRTPGGRLWLAPAGSTAAEAGPHATSFAVRGGAPRAFALGNTRMRKRLGHPIPSGPVPKRLHNHDLETGGSSAYRACFGPPTPHDKAKA
jgi:hypothetical protein